jgi:hypothetical protein
VYLLATLLVCLSAVVKPSQNTEAGSPEIQAVRFDVIIELPHVCMRERERDFVFMEIEHNIYIPTPTPDANRRHCAVLQLFTFVVFDLGDSQIIGFDAFVFFFSRLAC